MRNYVLKFRRARYHLDRLNGEVGAWFKKSGTHSQWAENDPNDPNQVLIKALVEEIPAEPVSLIIGDVLQNFRGCLEHLAYDLAMAHSGDPLPEDVAADSQFPIVGDVSRKGIVGKGAEMFASQRKCIRGMCPEAQQIVENVQPYIRGSDFVTDPLWLLSALSNIDKHRLTHVAAVYPHLFTLNPGRPARNVITIQNARGRTFSTTGNRLEGETVIAKIGVERVSDPKVNVELEISPSIAFSEGIAIHEDVFETLRRIQDHILVHVLDPLAKFLS